MGAKIFYSEAIAGGANRLPPALDNDFGSGYSGVI
jgi:hypothetical protein